MFCTRFQHIALLALLPYFLLSANAVPLSPRQASPTSVMTVQTLNTVAGQMTQTCIVTLTPITDNNGQPAVEEVRSCTINAGANANNNGGQQLPPPSATVDPNAPPAPPGVTTSFDSSATAQFTTAATTTAAGLTIDPAAASSSALSTPPAGIPGAPTSNAQVVVNGISTVPATAVATPPPGVTTASAAADSAQTQGTSASASLSGSAAAANASTTAAAAFQLPGKQLSVLPIGLGVFAGISVIALIVVGLVTYERTKYRKAFRQRKLAETGAAMGYGGMAQR